MSDTLVFTVALNGYQWVYRHCLDSQRRYAKRHGLDYVAVTRPYWTEVGVECCWLKLVLMKQALHHYRTVVFIDADAICQPKAPDIRQAQVEGKLLYMAKGRSGIFNSGVIMAVQHPFVFTFLDRVLQARNDIFAESLAVGWGENGHVAHFANAHPKVSTLDVRWNNTIDPDMPDYIRHFNHGPLRPHFTIRLFHKALARATRLLQRFRFVSGERLCALSQLHQKCLMHYPNFNAWEANAQFANQPLHFENCASSQCFNLAKTSIKT